MKWNSEDINRYIKSVISSEEEFGTRDTDYFDDVKDIFDRYEYDYGTTYLFGYNLLNSEDRKEFEKKFKCSVLIMKKREIWPNDRFAPRLMVDVYITNKFDKKEEYNVCRLEYYLTEDEECIIEEEENGNN